MINDLTAFSQTKRHKGTSAVAAPAVYARSVGKDPFTLNVIRVFPFLASKFGEFMQLVELDKCFIDSGVYYLWIVFYHT